MSELTFTIGEVATLLGITSKTIKHYHEIGLLPPPERDTNQYRLYRMSHIIQLQKILKLKQFGLSLKQIEIIVQSENPDALTQIVLNQHILNIQDELSRLQHQLTLTQNFMKTGDSLFQPNPSDVPIASSLANLSDAIRPHKSGLLDILVEFEREALFKLDQFDWDEKYDLFWHHAGKQFVKTLADEGLFIFWMERYLALAHMEMNDLQGKAWLQEFRYSPAKLMFKQALMPAQSSELPPDYQHHIVKLLSSLLYQEASSLQKHFLASLFA